MVFGKKEIKMKTCPECGYSDSPGFGDLKPGDKFYFKSRPWKIMKVYELKDAGIYVHYECVDSPNEKDIGQCMHTDQCTPHFSGDIQRVR